MSFDNLDVGSRTRNYFSSHGLRILATYISTCKSRQGQKGGRRERKKKTDGKSKSKLKN